MSQTVAPDFTAVDVDPDFVFKGNATSQRDAQGDILIPCRNISGGQIPISGIVDFAGAALVDTVVGGTVWQVDAGAVNGGADLAGVVVAGAIAEDDEYFWVKLAVGVIVVCAYSGAAPAIQTELYEGAAATLVTAAGTGPPVAKTLVAGAGGLLTAFLGGHQILA